MEAKGIKIGFLGYCDSPSSSDKNCSEIRKMFSAGPAVYSEVIAIRDVNNLRKVFKSFLHMYLFSTPFSKSPLLVVYCRQTLK